MGRGFIIFGRRVRFRFIFFIAAIVIAVLYFSDIRVKPRNFATVEYGAVTAWNRGDGLIVRNEEVFDSVEYGKIEYISADGELVEKDELLAVLYKNNYSEDLIDNLYQVKQKISDYQKKNIIQDILDNDYNQLESSINELVFNIQASIHSNSFSSLEYQEKQLHSLLERRQKLLNRIITPDQYLEQLYEKEAELTKQLNEWKIDIVAPDSGIVSFQLDGLERVLNSGSLDYMTIDEFLTIKQSLLIQDEKTDPNLDRPLFRLINPEKWYLVCHIPTSEIYYEKNDVVNVKLLGSNQKILEGVIYKIDKRSDSSLVVLEFTEGIESVIHIRNLPVEIGKTVEGLIVPTSSIIKNNGKTGIELVYKGDIIFMEVRIKAMDEEKAVIEKVGDVEGLNLHDKVVIQ